MTVAAGSRLGPYEVLSPLGAGGMGEVWKARDTRLERTVAIKVLPEHLSRSEEIRQRFEREAKTISSLSHPHICALYDVGNQDGTEYLVMEYLEGETLTDRLSRGALPPEQVLRFGIEIADALDKAHRQGIVHRDLKPGNIMLTKSGIKLLDFGLAKAVQPASPNSSLSVLPTQAGMNLTQEGTILGTFQYMAPEQLEGKEADVRSDIFAFGAVLYEMATGQKAFVGKSQASLIAAILERNPAPISTVQPMAPPALDRVVRACLAKDPEERWQTAHDVALQLRWIAEGGSQAGVPAPLAARRRNRERLWMSTAVLFAVAAAALAFLLLRAPREPVRVLRSSLAPPEGGAFWLDPSTPGPPVLSADGRRIAFCARAADGKIRLHVRSLDAFEARAFPGTEEAQYPFWSPDSRSIGFFTGGKLKAVESDGGPPVTLCSTDADPKGGAWSPSGVIVFARGSASTLWKIPAGGGDPVELTHFDPKRGDNSHRHPRFLPDGKHFLYLARSINAASEGHAVVAASLDGTPEKVLLRSPGAAEYGSGHLLFLRERTLMARPFDAGRLAFTGDAIPLAENVLLLSLTSATGVFSVSGNGTLVYQTLQGQPTSKLQWISRDGAVQGTLGDAADYIEMGISRDGKRVATTVREQSTGTRDLWVIDVSRNLGTRFTFDPANETSPLFSPDGNWLAFSSNRKGHDDIYRKALSGPADEELLVESKNDKNPAAWSPDGRYLAYTDTGKETKADIFLLPLEGERKPQVFLQTPFLEYPAAFSPDGRWLAYGSDESGNFHIYVTSFPRPGRKWQVSTENGAYAYWSADGKEIVYHGFSGQLWAVEVSAKGDSVEIGAPKSLFKLAGPPRPSGVEFFPTSDHQRFLVLDRGQKANTLVNLVVNWPAAARR
jgi:Tol biopolymer transport system component/predicted Ser/Thr protein kinase